MGRQSKEDDLEWRYASGTLQVQAMMYIHKTINRLLQSSLLGELSLHNNTS